MKRHIKALTEQCSRDRMCAREELESDHGGLRSHETGDYPIQTLSAVVAMSISVHPVEGGGIDLEVSVQREHSVEVPLGVEVNPKEVILKQSCGVEH